MIESRLVTCAPGRAGLSGAGSPPVAFAADGCLVRCAPGVAARARLILEVEGREAVPTAWEANYEPGSSRSNPHGRPIITITRVR